MANKYSRLKPKIKPLPFIILGVIIVVIVVSVILLQPNTSKQFYETYKIDRVEEDESYLFKEINLKTLNKMVENEQSFLIYFGYPGCSNCMSEVKSYYNEFYNQELHHNLDNIYYLNLTKLKGKEFESLGDKYGIRLSEDQQTFNAFYFYIEEGEIKFDRNSDSYKKPLLEPAGEIKLFYIEVKEFLNK